MRFDSRGGVGHIASVLLVLSFLFSPLSALAQDTTPSFIRESVGLGRVVSPESQFGAFTYQVPLTLPPGRNGVMPSLALTYNSQNPRDTDLFGYGWGISIPYIMRYNREGLGTLYSTSSPHFYSSMSGELATTSNSSVFLSRNDDGSFLQYTFNGNSWTVIDKKGLTYKFGTSTAGRQDDPNDSSRAFKWMLQEVDDANGNNVLYSYSKDSGQIYPSNITYTGNGATPGIFSVAFSMSLRATSTATTSDTGFGVVNRYKVDQITAKVNGTTVRSYALAYTNGENGSRLLLSSVTEAGQDETTGSTITLQPTTFTYSTSSMVWSADTNRHIRTSGFVYIEGGFSKDQGVNVSDVNGDGYADLVWSFYDVNRGNFQETFINNGSDWDATASSTWNTPCLFTAVTDVNQPWLDKGGRLVDVNGDGLPDFICTTTVLLNTGSGWATSTTWTLPEATSNGSADQGVRFVDVNGDGLVDLVRSYSDGSTTTQKVYTNNGHGWTYDASWTIPVLLTGSTGDTEARLVDVNGDGLSDILQGGATTTTYLNTGSGWATSTTAYASMPFDPGGLNVRYADYNGDGLIDVGQAEGTSCIPPLAACWSNNIYLNTGSGWALKKTGALPRSFEDQSTDSGARIADVNGDGLPDIVISNQNWLINEADLSHGSHPDLLTGVTESSGRTITATYEATPQYRDSSNNLLNAFLPMALMTVQKLQYYDGISATSTDTYQYQDGRFYFGSPLDRMFAGFHSIIKTDDVGTVTKTYFHQGNDTSTSTGEYADDQSKIGKAYRVENYDGSNNLYSLTVNKWDDISRGGQANFLLLDRTTTLNYDGNADHRDVSEEYAYSTTTGALTQKVSWGEVNASSTDGSFADTGSDKLTTNLTYAASSTGLLLLPSDQTVTDQSGNKMNESRFYYDSLSLGSVIKGNLTKQESWKSGTTYINSQKAYNSYGLVTQDTNPRGKITTYSYDTYNLYPATTTDPLGHTTANWYDYSSGKAIQTKDPNGLIFQSLLDPLDRILTEKQPDLVTPTTLVTKASYVYTDSGMPRSVRKTSYLNSATSTDVYTYLDAFGRTLETRTTAEGNNTYAVKDSHYNTVGLLKDESLPFFASSTVFTATSSPAASYLLSRYTYDPLKRVLSVANAVGTTSNSYDQWKVRTTDANGNPKDLYKDARGNLAQVVEYTGTSTGTTTYSYDGNNNLILITDALGNIRHFSYDGLGRKIKAEDLHASADTSFGSTTYVYDDAGNLTQQIDAKNQTVNRTYDDLNRLLTEDYLGQAGTETTNRYDWCANGMGRLCSVLTADASTTDQYNALGLVSSESKSIGSNLFTTTYLYDRLGNQTLITLPDSSETKYDYNNAGLLEKVSNQQSGASLFTTVISNLDYAPTGKVTYKVFGNGVTTTNTYDAKHLYRLTRTQTIAPAQ